MPAAHRKSPWWIGLMYVGPLLILVGMLAIQLAVSDRLPDPMAVHWGLGGSPDGHMSQTTSLLLMTGLWTGFWLLVFLATRRARGSLGLPFGILYFLGGYLFVIQASIINLNLDAADWTEASEFSWAAVGVAVGSGLALAVVASLLARRIPTEPLPEPHVAPPGDLPEGDEILWEMSVGNWGLTAVAAVMVLAVVLTWYFVRIWWVFVLMVAVAGAVVLFTSARVAVREGGVRVSLGPFGWPRKTIDIADIRQAAVEHIEPLSWGGWGWRIKPPASAVVMRKGEALMLDLNDDKRFGVTVDEAATAAGLVNALVSRRQRTR